MRLSSVEGCLSRGPEHSPGTSLKDPMPSTHLSLHYHVVFSTKNREPTIDSTWRARLHAYLGGSIRQAGGVPDCIGGPDNHVHLLMGLRATHRLSDVMRDIKSASSAWVRQEVGAGEFGWQEGYGGFSVNGGQREKLREYISNQEEHHRKRTFEEEYLEFLRQHQVQYDDRYVW